MRTPALLLFVFATATALYWPTTTFDYVRADDQDLIAGNQRFLSDLRNLPHALTRSYFDVDDQPTTQRTYYRPLTIASFMIDAARGGADPRGYHLTNVLLHAVVACLVLVLALRWGARPAAAALAALIFAVHPINVQAVAWIAGRNELLVALFGVLSLLFFAALKGCASSGVGQPFRAAGHVVAFALALFSKETGLLFPLMAVVHQRLIARTALTQWQRAALASDAAIVIGWIALRSRALGGVASDVVPNPLWVAAMNAPQLLVQIGKMLVPLRLNVSPGVDAIGVAIGIAALIVFAIAGKRSSPRAMVIFVAIWVFLFLAPPLLVPELPAYEHRVYLPLIGVVAVLVTQLAARKGPPYIVIVAIAFAVLAYERLPVFRDPFTYWTDAARDSRFGPIAHVNLGQLHEAAGRLADARREYLRALERDPDTPKAHNDLGVVLMALDEPELAREHFLEEVRRHPANYEAWFNLGLWTETHGDPQQARRYYHRAAAENPSFKAAAEKLGRP